MSDMHIPTELHKRDSNDGTRLRSVVATFPGQRFAVVDGGHFEDFPAMLKRARLFGRSLYLDQADREVEKAGPWLVALGQSPDATEAIVGAVGTKPAAVFWSCEGGEAVLYRHLRTLNLARIPAWAADGGAAPSADAAANGGRTIVMFRHYDPRVLGALLPALHAAQFARVLGPAEEIAFEIEHVGMRRVLADKAWPAPPAGPLTIDDAQIAALGDARWKSSRRDVASYLRQAAPEETRSLEDEKLLAHVTASEQSARALGLVSERSRAKWAYLMLTHPEDRTRQRFGAFVATDRDRPERQLDRLFSRLIFAAARNESAPLPREPR